MSTDTMSTDTMNTPMLADQTYDEDVIATTAIGRSLGTDYFGLRDELTDAERARLGRGALEQRDGARSWRRTVEGLAALLEEASRR